jgi:hexokinase
MFIAVSGLILHPHPDLCFMQVEDAMHKIHLTGGKVMSIKKVFCSEMECGIHEQPSSLQMENTYIPELPDGTGN